MSIFETISVMVWVAIVVSVAVASYQRSRCLSKYSVPKSLAITIASGLFWEIWVIAASSTFTESAKNGLSIGAGPTPFGLNRS